MLDGFLAFHMQVKVLITLFVFRAEPGQRLNQKLSTSQLSLICRFVLGSQKLAEAVIAGFGKSPELFNEWEMGQDLSQPRDRLFKLSKS